MIRYSINRIINDYTEFYEILNCIKDVPIYLNNFGMNVNNDGISTYYGDNGHSFSGDITSQGTNWFIPNIDCTNCTVNVNLKLI